MRRLVQTAIPIAVQPTEPRTKDLSSIHILVVDDNPDSLDIAAFGLELANATVSVATSGAEALEQLDRAVPDVLISDIGMPEMDGYDLMRQVRRRSPEKGGNVWAIALTAYATDATIDKTIEAGFQCYLAKPIEPDELVAIICELFCQN